MNRRERRLHALKRQVARVERRRTALNRVGDRYVWARVLVFFGGVPAFVAAYYYADTGVWAACGMVWLALFGLLVRHHRRLKTGIARHEIWCAIKRAHIARAELDWEHMPAPFTSPHAASPIEVDLDLTGTHALHRLLDVGVSRAGSARLLAWLSSPQPDPEQARARQALVRELTPLWTFRDKLHLNAVLAHREAGARWGEGSLRAWLQAPVAARRGVLGGLTGLALLDALLFALYAAGMLPPLWMGTFVAYVAAYLWHLRQAGDAFAMALALRDPLVNLRSVFTYLENYRYGRNRRLEALCAPFWAGDVRPSRELKRIGWVLAAAGLRNNPYLAFLLNAAMPWDLYVVYCLERRRTTLAAALPEWLDRWHELEALGALANLAYLNPAYSFPEIAERDAQGPQFEAVALGHPLIPAGRRVCNDFTLHQTGTLAMITGSNMAGKSTFLRTIGINLCLAYAGGPVNARRFYTVPFRLFSCIRVTDSVTDGISYFYAEVKRLKALLDALEQEQAYPLFFLIDEIFRGTNNRERLIGSRAYVRALVGRRGVGVLSTHDLELVRLADEMPQIKNYHFAEHIVEGRMVFDYALRPGPCPSTNALKIMEMEGLPV